MIRSTSCLVLGWVFGDGGSNGAIYGSKKSKVAATTMLENFKWRYLRNRSSDPLHVLFYGGVFATADLMALFSIRTNPRWRPPLSWIISNGRMSATAHDLLIYRAHLCDSTAFLLTIRVSVTLCVCHAELNSCLPVLLPGAKSLIGTKRP